MQQETRAPRKPFPKLLPFIAGAVSAALVLVACDRPAAPADMAAAEVPATAASPTNVEAPREIPAPQAAVAAPPREALGDNAITSRVKSEILADPAMRGADVSVNTDHGVVVLAGLVKTPEQAAVASAHAQHQDGVMRVDNHLAPALQ